MDDLVKKGKSVSICERNLHILATETYKVRNDLGPEISKDIFPFLQKPYNLIHSAKAKKLHSVLWDGKHTLPCLQNMGDSPFPD